MLQVLKFHGEPVTWSHVHFLAEDDCDLKIRNGFSKISQLNRYGTLF